MKYLDDQQVKDSFHWARLIDALENAYALLALSPSFFTVPQRLVINQPLGTFLAMPVVDAEGWFGVKQVSVVPHNPRRGLPTVQAFFTLFDESGSPALAAQATTFTYLRTAAVSAVAAKHLAPRSAENLLVIGTGGLAPWMAEAHAQVRHFRRLQVWGRRPEAVSEVMGKLESRREMLPRDIVIEPAADIATATNEADVVSLATSSSRPILSADWLSQKQHIDAVGAFTPEMAEVAPGVLESAEVWVDDLESARAKAGDLLQAEEHGWSFDSLKGALPELVTTEGRTSDTGVTLFKSVGTAISDMVFARQLHDM